MLIPTAPRRPRGESIVPMINVVFLLLIFFLMTAQIAPPEPFEVTPPDSQSEKPAEHNRTLYLSADGEMAMNDARGEDVFTQMSDLTEHEPLIIRADRALKAEIIAALLPRIARTGVRKVQLVSVAR